MKDGRDSELTNHLNRTQQGVEQIVLVCGQHSSAPECSRLWSLRNRMRQSRTSGSVGGLSGNRRVYPAAKRVKRSSYDPFECSARAR